MRRYLLAVLFATAVPSAAEPLYNGQNAGAPESAVLPAFPSAKLEREAGGIRSWRAEDVPFGDMWTYFEFVDGGLAKVTMFGRGGDRFVEIKDYLRKRYGAPALEGAAGDSAIAVWQFGTTRIIARLTPTTRSSAEVLVEPFTVTYTSTTERPAAPL